MILITPVGDSKLKILDPEALRRNIGKDKIVRTKAWKSYEKLATGFGNFKTDEIKTGPYSLVYFFNTSYIIQQVIL